MKAQDVFKRIVIYCAKHKITQKKFAEKAGVTPVQMSNWASGRTKKLNNASRINVARVLGVSANSLMKG